MTALLVGKSTIKMDEVTTVILQNEVLKKKNPASSSGNSSTLVVSRGVGGNRRSDRRSRRGWSKSRMRDLSKTKYYRCNELEHLVRDCSQLRDRTRATAATVRSDSKGDALDISDEVSIFF